MNKEVTNNRKELQFGKNDLILILVLLIAAVAIYAGIRLYSSKNTKNAMVVVTVDGEEYGRYPLSEQYTETILIIKSAKKTSLSYACRTR